MIKELYKDHKREMDLLYSDNPELEPCEIEKEVIEKVLEVEASD